jgi:AbrB family looped-hinge helix DNA binding protein
VGEFQISKKVFVERLKPWKVSICGWYLEMEIVKVDRQGRFYLPKEVRKAAGIDEGTVLDVTVSHGEIVLRARKQSIARDGRGVFRVKRPVEDVDREIKEKSIEKSLGELDEVRRR